jgi:rod shape-determining protein MreC
MLEFLRRNQILLTSGCLLIVSLLLVSSQARQDGSRDPLGGLLLEGVRPMQTGISQVGRAAGSVWQRYVALVGLQRENEALRRRLLDLEREAVRSAEVGETNRRLAELLSFRERLRGQAQAAQVIGKDPRVWFRSFVINKGESDGVRKGMAVLSAHGAVGQVYATGAHSARVLLITDHNSGVDAVVQRSRARGIVEGAADEGCTMKYLRQGEDVEVGDRVVTSGLDGVFPKGIVIGHITGLSRRSRGLLQAATVEPAAPFDRLEEVLVVDASAELIDEAS